MYRFYIGNGRMEEGRIVLTGGDVNHMKNVLRMKGGEELSVCTTDGTEYCCRVVSFPQNEAVLEIVEQMQSVVELEVSLVLFQGIPKREKMEFIIQKAVELGVSEIVPVMTRRVVVRLEDPKREEKKLARWQAIAESAAKQSGRAKIPKVCPVMAFEEAVTYSKTLSAAMIPYEMEKDRGMRATKEWMRRVGKLSSAGIFIGPEGGFEAEEVKTAEEAGVVPVSLGRRILRTETAAVAALSILMYELECGNE